MSGPTRPSLFALAAIGSKTGAQSPSRLYHPPQASSARRHAKRPPSLPVEAPPVPLTPWEQLLEPLMGVHISGVVAVIAAVPGIAAYGLRHVLPLPASVVLWHIAGTGMLVAAAATEALAGRTTWIMGKRADGTINPVHFTLLWPYHVGLRAKLALQRRLSSEPSFSQVTDEYFIGAWPSEMALVPTVHPAVLDVTCELPLQVVPPAYLNLAVWDTHAPTAQQIETGVQWALAQRAVGRPVLVHCAHGHGRSATVLAAILIAEGKAKGASDAEALMKASRPRVRLNTRQRAALKQWIALREGTGKLE
ncbi:dual specificity phosphatase domain [Micractinium conductrix]|uniref:Dual specificity phosphatase domain n=1 Tax=Micractinium conductrix TaxID=554055 RepID=A0A2P6VBH3_9CHLO|nr:dual specificity phosphatase domain [Micractinium conductrix]|eukprot:PSC71447.1 dual specificity phosphatase domain [Micractinium conductrix]